MTIVIEDSPNETRIKELANRLVAQARAVLFRIQHSGGGFYQHYFRRCLVDSMPYVVSQVVDEKSLRSCVSSRVDDWFPGRPQSDSLAILKLAPRQSTSIASSICVAAIYSLIHALCDPIKIVGENEELICELKSLHDQLILICKDGGASRIDELREYYLDEQSRRIHRRWSQPYEPMQKRNDQYQFNVWERCCSGADTSIDGVCRWAQIFCSPASRDKAVCVLTGWIREFIYDFLLLGGVDGGRYLSVLSEIRDFL